jgi:hypothetical protein
MIRISTTHDTDLNAQGDTEIEKKGDSVQTPCADQPYIFVLTNGDLQQRE